MFLIGFWFLNFKIPITISLYLLSKSNNLNFVYFSVFNGGFHIIKFENQSFKTIISSSLLRQKISKISSAFVTVIGFIKKANQVNIPNVDWWLKLVAKGGGQFDTLSWQRRKYSSQDELETRQLQLDEARSARSVDDSSLKVIRSRSRSRSRSMIRFFVKKLSFTSKTLITKIGLQGTSCQSFW